MAEVTIDDVQIASEAMFVADVNYRDNAGNSILAGDLIDKCREAQVNYRYIKGQYDSTVNSV